MNFVPRFVIVSSPMRTGSTWLVEMLRGIIEVPDNLVANSIEQIEDLVGNGPAAGIIKSHQIVDLDWAGLSDSLPIVRLTRNYKDSLISRVLYAIHIRPNEGRGVGDDELEDLVDTLGDFTDAEFVNAFFEQCPLVEKWLAEIVVHERGESPQCVTLSYEAMMYNPYDQIRTLIHRFWPESKDIIRRVDETVRNSIRLGYSQRDTFLRRKAVGVGGWETWLTCKQSERIDSLYFELRERAFQKSNLRAEELIGGNVSSVA